MHPQFLINRIAVLEAENERLHISMENMIAERLEDGLAPEPAGGE